MCGYSLNAVDIWPLVKSVKLLSRGDVRMLRCLRRGKQSDRIIFVSGIPMGMLCREYRERHRHWLVRSKRTGNL